ncbi:hypothetical protein BSFP_020100 [Burkholderia stabilis]|uniref:Uncharacterized protein n=1 Tax=Burkholderia stabilis TaxID=95485 RepID=A0A1Y1BLL6_9BURK|nr:hypothetical protein BSFP_020100 [Burkholderia stabilis]
MIDELTLGERDQHNVHADVIVTTPFLGKMS